MGNIILIGLPSSGKTTYLAALWFLVEGKHRTVFTVDQLDGDREYLNNLRDKWLSCNPVDRTRRNNEYIASITLLNTNTNQRLLLNIPDLSGETFLDQWLNRSWTQDFYDLIAQSDGVFIFVHPDDVVEPTRIDQADLVKSEISDNEDESRQVEDLESLEWDPKLVPTQVQLVELLQFVDDANCTEFPLKIALIISAWDLVANLGDSPDTWLKKRLPLLWQYLSTNKHKFPHRIYGVSAQGGNYETDEEKLSSYNDPQERIVILELDSKHNDLTIPLLWLTSEKDEE